MPKPPVTKPRSFPDLGYGGGSWEWDAARRKVVLRFRVNGKQCKVRADSTTRCIQLRDERRSEGAVEKAVEVETAMRLANGEATVTELMTAWVGFKVGPQTAPMTVYAYNVSIRLVAASPLGERIARTVTIGDVENLLAYCIDERDHGKASLIKLRCHLGMAFKYGVRHGYSEINPARGADLPGRVRDVQEPVWLDADGFRAMRRYLVQHPTTVHVALLTGLLTGLRPGEVLGMCWDVIDWEAGTVHVKRGLQRSKDGRVISIVDTLKTPQAERVVELPPDLLAALHQLRVDRVKRQMAARVWHESDAVFVRDATGRLFGHATLNGFCVKACEAIGVAPLSANKLRHTNASMLLDLGVRVPDVSKHLGHKDMVMVMTTYGHSMKVQVPTAALLADEA